MYALEGDRRLGRRRRERDRPRRRVHGTVSVAAQTEQLTAPANDADLDAGETRVDLITVDSTGATNTTEGSPGAGTDANPVIAPDIPSGQVLIAAVTVDGGATSLTSGDIHDYRIPSIHPATQTALDNHTSNTSNPHNVTDDQTGAAAALSNHSANATAHHSPPHLEAKETAGSSSSESVSWTSAFSVTPIIATSTVEPFGSGQMTEVDSRSTTGATLKSFKDDGSTSNKVKLAIAMEGT